MITQTIQRLFLTPPKPFNVTFFNSPRSAPHKNQPFTRIRFTPECNKILKKRVRAARVLCNPQEELRPHSCMVNSRKPAMQANLQGPPTNSVPVRSRNTNRPWRSMTTSAPFTHVHQGFPLVRPCSRKPACAQHTIVDAHARRDPQILANCNVHVTQSVMS